MEPNHDIDRNMAAPKVKIWDILAWIKDLDVPFTTRDVAAIFRITGNDAYTRVHKLHTWGMVKYSPFGGRKSWPYKFVITNWGRKFLEDREDRENKK